MLGMAARGVALTGMLDWRFGLMGAVELGSREMEAGLGAATVGGGFGSERVAVVGVVGTILLVGAILENLKEESC